MTLDCAGLRPPPWQGSGAYEVVQGLAGADEDCEPGGNESGGMEEDIVNSVVASRKGPLEPVHGQDVPDTAEARMPGRGPRDMAAEPFEHLFHLPSMPWSLALPRPRRAERSLALGGIRS